MPIRISAHQPGTAVVAVPSRIRGEPTESDPLRGLRVAVKDNFHMKGLRTSLCNRAYRDTYPPQDETAACIRKLELAGAYIVGTVRMAAFAATEEPIECVDYEAPWNPRGDGYQSPAGSSSGSGAAVASYDWLDIAVGSDSRPKFRARLIVVCTDDCSERQRKEAGSLEWMLRTSPFTWSSGHKRFRPQFSVSDTNF